MSWYVEFSIIWQVYFNHERQRLSVLLYFFLFYIRYPFLLIMRTSHAPTSNETLEV